MSHFPFFSLSAHAHGAPIATWQPQQCCTACFGFRWCCTTPPLFQMVLDSLLTKALGEHRMESFTREQSSVTTMVSTQGRRTGRTRRTSSPNGKDVQMFARLELNGVAVLNCQIGLRVSHKTKSLLPLRRISGVAVLNSLL